jgi:hypothetical protein
LPSSKMTIQIERPATKKTWKGEEKQGRQHSRLPFSGVGLVLLVWGEEMRRSGGMGSLFCRVMSAIYRLTRL